jgi:hypothetical protein
MQSRELEPVTFVTTLHVTSEYTFSVEFVDLVLLMMTETMKQTCRDVERNGRNDASVPRTA